MKRLECSARPNWEKKVEESGLIYHHTGEGVYWNEAAFYRFSSKEVDILEAATNELQQLCLTAGQHIIDNNRYTELGIPKQAIPAIEWAWKNEPPAIYGRMDLAFNGVEPPKLLEYNADTPTGLLEAAVAQWNWKEDVHQHSDQFNSIHERLVAKWKELTGYCSTPLYFAHIDDPQGEDTMTTTYLRETAEQGGFKTEAIIMNDIGWDGKHFVDMHNKKIESIFKLYPWEWMVHEQFGENALKTMDLVQWIEPIWKMLWSNKGLLPILWELNPNHPNLLESYFDGPRSITSWVKKPKMSREGANITIHDTEEITTPGEYGEEGFVYQARGPVFKSDAGYAVLGSWVIDQESAGIGVRESKGPITNNLSTFVPHIFE